MSLNNEGFKNLLKPDYESIRKSFEQSIPHIEIAENPLIKNSERSVKALESLNQILEQEYAARIEAEHQAKKERKADRVLVILGIIIGSLTLTATIIGILVSKS